MWKSSNFWSEIGSGFQEPVTHPHQELRGVPPGDYTGTQQIKTQLALITLPNSDIYKSIQCMTFGY